MIKNLLSCVRIVLTGYSEQGCEGFQERGE